MKWKKLAFRILIYIAIAIVLSEIPEPYQFVKIKGRDVFVIAFIDFVFAYYGDYGEWKNDKDKNTK